MIKIVLGLSLFANLILVYFLQTKKGETEIVERVIIEAHEKADLEVRRSTQKASPQIDNQEKEKEPSSKSEGMAVLDSHVFQEAGEKMESERSDFLKDKLHLSEDKLIEHNRLRDEFFKRTADFWNKGPMRELSFDERKQMLDLEEGLYKKLEKLHGKKNWARYQKFRENYNENGYKKQLEENEPFIFMGL